MLHLVHVEQWFHPEYGYQVQQFISMHAKDMKITVVCSEASVKAYKETAESMAKLDAAFCERHGCDIIRLKPLVAYREKQYLPGLIQTIRKLNPDVVFCHGVEYIPTLQFLMAGLHHRYPMLTDSHDLPTAPRKPWLSWCYRLLMKLLVIPKINKSGIISYYLTSETRDLFRLYGIRDDLHRFLPLGVDFQIFYPDEQARKSTRAEMGVKDDEFLIVYTGKHDFVKIPHLLFEALKLLSGELKQRCHVLFVGKQNAAYLASHPMSSATLGCKSFRMEKVVPYHELPAYYRAADLACFPAQNTLSSQEAQACGCPVVMQDDPTNRERLTKGGRVYPPGDIPALAQVLEELLTSPEKLKELGQGGVEYMREHYDYRKVIAGLEATCRELSQRNATAKQAG